MRKTAVVITIGITALCIGAWAQNTDNPPRPGEDQVRAEDRQEDRRPKEAQSLTAEQKAQVKAILSKYTEASLTANDAKAINEAFREAGLRNGPALQQAIREAGFVPEKISVLAPPSEQSRERRIPSDWPRRGQPGRNRGPADRPEQGKGGGYSIEQAVSDRAQLSTIAFDGLAFLTGDFGCNTFLPPGKVADFCGFQYMRDVVYLSTGSRTALGRPNSASKPFAEMARMGPG